MAVVGRVIGCIATLTLWLNVQVRAFNLETRLPVIKQGARDSYFGFSVAQHQILEGSSSRVKEQVLLIGAPRYHPADNSSDRTGAIYRCPISTVREDCTQLDISYAQLKYEDRLRSDQWLGVTVKSQGPGKFVLSCAHRHLIVSTEFRWGQGVCYSFNSTLHFSRDWEPCLNRPVEKAHEQFGYCQAGTSAHISEDFDIVIGSPGTYTWRGTVFTNSIRFAMLDDKSWYFGPLLDSDEPVPRYSYLGMSVTSGKFFGSTTSFVGGAPRSRGHGQVFFFKKQRSGPPFDVQLVLDGEQFASSYGYTLASLDINSDGQHDLVVGAPFYFEKDKGGAIYVYMNSKEGLDRNTVPQKFTGKPESRFGFAISSTGDINRDGFEDLAVGAPYEGKGAVYIYLGKSDGLHAEPSQIIRAEDFPKGAFQKRSLATFGYSLSGGMDMDSNGYPDLLAGAYESDNAVLLMARPIINMKTSVKGNLANIDPSKPGCEADRDANLVCFSFEACFQFNSSELSQGTSLTLRYRIEADTFTGKKYYRVIFHNAVNSTTNIVEKDVVVEGSRLFEESCSQEIVYLKNRSDIQNPIKFKLTYNLVQRKPQMVKPGGDVPDVNRYPILNQVEASKIFEWNDPDVNVDSEYAYRLKCVKGFWINVFVSSLHAIIAEAKFLNDCGVNEICECDLHVEAHLNLTHKDRRPVFYLGSEQLILTITVSNRNESAYEPTIYITHPPSVTFAKGESLDSVSISCIPVAGFNGTIAKCELTNPMKKGETEVQVRFGTKKVRNEEKELKFIVKVNTTSVELTEEEDLELVADIIIKAELELHGQTEYREQVSYGGEIIGESAITYKDEIGDEIIHKYYLRNGGPGEVSYLDVVIHWPHQTAYDGEPGKWVLYLTDAPTVKGNGYCQTEDGQVNPLGYKNRPDENLTGSEYILPDSGSKQRRKREAAKPQELRKEGKSQKVETLDCKIGTAQCITFSCRIRELKKEESAAITIKSRLWNSTFVSEYPSVDSVSIVSRAEIRLDEHLGIEQENINDDFASVTSSAIPDIELYQKGKGVPLWIIILAVCGGILLLIIVIICLWKFGFFKRKKPGYIPAATSEKEKEANNL